VTIRTPTIADADDLGEIHVEAWQAAYRRGLMPDAYLDALTVEARARVWRALLAGDPGPAMTRLVSERDGHLAGFIVVGPCRDDGGIAEVHALNVRPRAWGEGHGRDLLSAG
jgi:GNAT superfamily N-acetyltransferase